MADRPLSDPSNPRVVRPLGSADRLYVVQSGVGKYATIDDILTVPDNYVSFSGDYTLVAGDEIRRWFESNVTTASRILIPPDNVDGVSAGPIPYGATIFATRIGSGTLAVASNDGTVTANFVAPYGLSALQIGSDIKMRHRSWNQWIVTVS